MKFKLILPLTAFVLFLSSPLTTVNSHSIMGGFKGHHRGHGAVELLLATGILAKLLNHRAKHGASVAGRHILHALLGGHRYPPQHHARYPLEMPTTHHALLQEELLDPHASMAALTMPLNEADLLMNQESALLGARAPMLMGQESTLFGVKSPMLMSSSMLSDTSLLAEAHLRQQLLAARRARRLMEARRLLAAQEASHMLAAQSEVSNLLAAQEAVHNHGFLSADQSQQVFTSMAPPKTMPQIQKNKGNQVNFAGNSGPTSANLVSSETTQQFQGINAQGQQHISGSQGNYQSSGQSGNNLISSESGRQSQSMLYSQPSPVYQGSSATQGNYHSSAPPPGKYLGSTGNQGNYQSILGPQSNFFGNSGFQGISGQKISNFMTPEVARQLQAAAARSDDVFTIPPDLDDEDAAKIVASLHGLL